MNRFFLEGVGWGISGKGIADMNTYLKASPPGLCFEKGTETSQM